MAAAVTRTVEQLKREQQVMLRQLRIVDAREKMLAFGHMMMPDTTDQDNSEVSEYQASAPAKCLCSLIEEIELGHKKRVAVSMPPQMGKTINLSIFGAAWIWGRNPRARIVIVSYSQTRAEELGLMLKQLLESPQYQQVFPDVRLDPLAKSRSYIQNRKGGRIMLAGVGGAITGKTADYFFIDDPIKGEDDESDLTPTALERLWSWFFKVAYSRGSSKTRILITHTRWAEDDLIGRLCDPNHPERNKRFKGISEKWFYLNLPAVVTDPKLADVLGLSLQPSNDNDVIQQFGDKPMSSLWPENKSLAFFAEWKQGDSRSFSALAMGQPAPDDGVFFLKEHLVEYDSIDKLPANLTKYGASDHAVSVKQGRDYTVVGCIGIDEFDNIWVLPDVIWERMETDTTVDSILHHLKKHKPTMWWAEDENIRKAFGPFLLKRMHEEKIYGTVIDPIRPAGDKKTRARSIQGRISMKKVFFPSFAPWWADAKAQMLRFPFAANDDFVDFMSLFGLGLLKEYKADPVKSEDSANVIRTGSMEWILADTRRKTEKAKMQKASGGW